MKLAGDSQVQKIAKDHLHNHGGWRRNLRRREPSLELVDQPVEQQVRGAAEDPPYPLLRNGMNVPLEVTPAKCLKVDDGKEEKVVVRQYEEVAEKIFEAGSAGLVLDVVQVNDHPEHEHGAQDWPEISRNREAAGSAAIDADSEDGHQQQNPPTKFNSIPHDAEYQESSSDQQGRNRRAQQN